MARRTPKLPPAAVSTAMADTPATPQAVVDTAAEMVEPVATAAVETSTIALDSAAQAVVAPEIKAAEPVVAATEAVASTVEKDVTPMATQFETPKTLTDAGDRAKAAFAKTQHFAADFGEFSKGNVEAMVEAGKIAAKGLETLGQDTADYTRRSFESMTATMKSLASVKSPTEFFQLQSEYARSAFDGAVQQTSKSTEAMIKLASDAAQPLSNRFAVAVEKVKTAA